MSMFKKLQNCGGLFRRGTIQSSSARQASGTASRVTYGDVRLASLGLTQNRRGSFDTWLRRDLA